MAVVSKLGRMMEKRGAGTVELALVEEGGVAMSESYFELAASADAPIGSLVRMTL